MINDVKIKDRKEEIEHIRMALNTVGIPVDYSATELITLVTAGVNKKKGKFTLRDAMIIRKKWREDLDKYFERIRKEECEEMKKQNNNQK
jgi:hypothetical protein